MKMLVPQRNPLQGCVFIVTTGRFVSGLLSGVQTVLPQGTMLSSLRS